MPQSGPPIGKFPPLRTSGELLRCEEATANTRILLRAGYDTAGRADTDSEWLHRERRKYVEKRDAWYRDNDPEAEEGREDAHAWLRDPLAGLASLHEDEWQELEWAIWDVQKLEASIYHSTRACDARNKGTKTTAGKHDASRDLRQARMGTTSY